MIEADSFPYQPVTGSLGICSDAELAHVVIRDPETDVIRCDIPKYEGALVTLGALGDPRCVTPEPIVSPTHRSTLTPLDEYFIGLAAEKATALRHWW